MSGVRRFAASVLSGEERRLAAIMTRTGEGSPSEAGTRQPALGLMLVGEAQDFQTPAATGEAPEWEHTRLLRRPGARIVAIDRLKLTRWRGPLLADRLDAVQVARLAARLAGAKTVLAQSEERGYLAALAMALRPGRRRLFIIFHGHRWWTRRNRILGGVVRRLGFVHVLCLSSALAERVRTTYRIPAARVHVTGYGADADFFRPMPAAGPPCVVSAGSASRDYRTLAQASRGLPVEVEVAADSTWYREALNVDASDIPANVQVFRCADYKALRALYARALFVVAPLQDVDFAAGYAVIAEAMAMGKAVITTRTRAPSDLVEPGVTGLYVPPGDAEALRQAMRRLLDDPAEALRMGEAGRAAVEREHSLDSYVERLTTTMGL